MGKQVCFQPPTPTDPPSPASICFMLYPGPLHTILFQKVCV